MCFKPAQQGSHSTLNPFYQTLGLATPFGGEARGSGRPLAGVWGLAPKVCLLGRDDLKKRPFLAQQDDLKKRLFLAQQDAVIR